MRKGECANEDALKKLLVENDVSNDEIEQLIAPCEDTQEELSVEDLDVVSGGNSDEAASKLFEKILETVDLKKVWKSMIGGPANYLIIWKSNYDYDKHGDMYKTYSKRTVDGAIRYWEKVLTKYGITY